MQEGGKHERKPAHDWGGLGRVARAWVNGMVSRDGDCVLGNWFLSYHAMQRAKGVMASEQEFTKYDNQTKAKFKKLQDKFQGKPAGPVLPAGVQ